MVKNTFSLRCWVVLLGLMLWHHIPFANAKPGAKPATPVEQKAPPHLNAEQAQKLLNDYSQRLLKIEKSLTKKDLSIEQLNQFSVDADAMLSALQKLRQNAVDSMDRSQKTLDALGPPPGKDSEQKEDEATKKLRDALTTEITNFSGRVKQANVLIAQSRSVVEKITQKKLAVKARGLLVQNVPLYAGEVWVHAAVQWKNFYQGFRQTLEDLKQEAQKRLAKGWLGWAFLSSLVLFSGALFYGRSIINGQLKRRHEVAEDHSAVHIKFILYRVFSNGLLPAIATLLLCLPFINVTHALTGWSETTTIFIYSVPIFLLFLATSFFNACLMPRFGHWQFLNLSPRSAKNLLVRIRPFILLLSLNVWLRLLIQAEFSSLESLTVVQFLLRLLICINGLLLLSNECWRFRVGGDETSALTSVNKQKRFYKFIRVVGILLFLTNPLLIIVGYRLLADALFLSFLSSFMLVVLLLMVHHVFSNLMAGFLGIHRSRFCLRLAEKKAQNIHFWLMAMVDAFLYVTAILGLLLIWGLDPTYLINTAKLLWYGVNIGGTHLSLLGFFIAVGVFVAVFMVTRFIQRLLNEKIFPNTSLDIGARHAFKTGIGYVGFAIAVVLAVSTMGFDLSRLAIVIGALSVGIGFGLQNIVSNFVSGIILLIERPIKLGDQIIVGADEGVVNRISVRATEIRTFDKTSVLIPNSELISGRVQNRTLRDTLTRISIDIGVAYGSPIKKVQDILLELANAHPDTASEPEPFVLFMDFGESALKFSLRAYLFDVNKRGSVPSELRFQIAERFQEEGINMPFPQRDVYLHRAKPKSE